jgi:hypothetical protein
MKAIMLKNKSFLCDNTEWRKYWDLWINHSIDLEIACGAFKEMELIGLYLGGDINYQPDNYLSHFNSQHPIRISL